MQAVHKQLGFSLIELIIAVVIVGILASIAMSAFQEYRKRGHDAAANQDVKSLATAEEAYYVDNAEYASCSDNADCLAKLDGIETFTDGVEVSATGNRETYTATGASENGTGRTYQFSNEGGLNIIE